MAEPQLPPPTLIRQPNPITLRPNRSSPAAPLPEAHLLGLIDQLDATILVISAATEPNVTVEQAVEAAPQEMPAPFAGRLRFWSAPAVAQPVKVSG